MPLRVLSVVSGALVLIGWAAGAPALAVTGLLALGYLTSLVIAPKLKCRSCGGAKVHSDVLGSRGVRSCWTCHGHGQYARLGTKLLRPEVAARISNGEHGRNY